MNIRFVKETDAKDLLAIYATYVEHTAITFEYDVPSIEEFRSRIKDISSFYPYLVAEEDGVILGYAYASSFHPRAAYAWSAEVTIYLKPDTYGKGLGSQLYEQLEVYLVQMGITNINACIATTSKETPYLTNGSRYFHEKKGYQLVGTFHKSGYKFNQWFDMIWMEKMIGEHHDKMTPPQSIHDVTKDEDKA